MNKFVIIFFLISFILCQNQTGQDVLQLIQKRAQSLNKKTDPNLENKFSQAKALERSGLYDEALLLYKEINRALPGNSKYFSPLKNYLKQTESWDTLLVYTQLFSQVRNHDIKSKLEFLDVYIWMEADEKWQQIAKNLIEDTSIGEKSIKNIEKKFNGKKVVTFVRKFEKFYPAENYHQDYYQESLANYLMYKKACGREEQLKKIWQ